MSYITPLKQKIIEMENLINLQQEIWIDIANFENYEISNTGKVRNKLNQKILKQTLDSHGYYRVALRINGKQFFKQVHRLLALYYIFNPLFAQCVDHIDCNQKNNQISNLRWASISQNSMNKKKKKNSTSYFKGVSFNQKFGKWQAQIKINGKSIYLGVFTNENEAGCCYDRKAIELFQEFAKLNFPKENYQQQNNQQ